MKRKAVIACAAGILLSFSGFTCGADKSREDANDIRNVCEETVPASSGCIDKSPPRSVAFNNHYPTVQTKCDGAGHRLYATSNEHGDHLTIIPDPTCPGYQQRTPDGVLSSTQR